MKPSEKPISFVTGLCWSPDDTEILACFSNQCPRVIDANFRRKSIELNYDWLINVAKAPEQIERKQKQEPQTSQRRNFASWSPNGLVIALGAADRVHIIDKITWQDCLEHKLSINAPSEDQCLSWFDSDRILSRLPTTGTRKQSARKAHEYFTSKDVVLETMGWTADGFLTVGTSLGAYTWDPVDDRIVNRLAVDPLPGELKSPVFSPRGKYAAALFVPDLAALSDLFWNINKSLDVARPCIYIWDIQKGTTFKLQSPEVNEVEDGRLFWSHDDRMIAWFSDNQIIMYDLWKQTTRTLLRTQNREFRNLAWSPKGAHIAVSDSFDGIVIYDVGSAARKANLRDASWGTYTELGCQVFAWSNSGNALAIGSTEDTIDIWKFPEKSLLSARSG